MFRFTTLTSGTTYIRVTNLALGMSPRLRVLGPDGNTVLFDVSYPPVSGDYLVIPLTGVAPGTTLYAEVSDTSGSASGGLYDLSVGGQLASDASASYKTFLPYLTR